MKPLHAQMALLGLER